MSEFCGETLGRLPGRFWEAALPELDLAGEERPTPTAGDLQGTSPFSLSPVIPSPSRNLCSSADARGSKIWRKKCAQASKDRKCALALDCTSWDVASQDPSLMSRSTPQSAKSCWHGIKTLVLAPSTFVEHITTASEWTRVRSRRCRSTSSLPSTSSASRDRFQMPASSSVWIKKREAKPTLGPPAPVGPTPCGLSSPPPRKSGLHQFLGFHWRGNRERAPVHGVSIAAMAGRLPSGNTGNNVRGSGSTGPFG
jgi:hypothetical protein